MLKVGKRTYAVALLLMMFGLAWTPPQASAQLLPPLPGLCIDTAPPTVSITSPASGATVAGTITVTASASDDCGVAGVNFGPRLPLNKLGIILSFVS